MCAQPGGGDTDVVRKIDKAVKSAPGFTTPEILILAEKYIHCSANWNSVVRDGQ